MDYILNSTLFPHSDTKITMLLPSLSLHRHLPSSPSPPYSHSRSHRHKPALYIKFRTSHRDNLRYLQTLSIIPPNTPYNNLPNPDALHHIFATIDFLKSHSFSDSDIPRLAAATPSLFSPSLSPSDIAPVLSFLAADVLASPAESRGLVLRCPHLLLSHADLCLRPTLRFLRSDIGLTALNRPTNRNAHLLNTRVDKLRVKVGFLMEEVGLSYEEAVKSLARLPAIFGYSLESNLRPKLEYLVGEMGREVEELKGFPQYFGFSLEKRIVPRHLHLKDRGVFRVPLYKMLTWDDHRFYAKWK